MNYDYGFFELFRWEDEVDSDGQPVIRNGRVLRARVWGKDPWYFLSLVLAGLGFPVVPLMVIFEIYWWFTEGFWDTLASSYSLTLLATAALWALGLWMFRHKEFIPPDTIGGRNLFGNMMRLRNCWAFSPPKTQISILTGSRERARTPENASDERALTTTLLTDEDTEKEFLVVVDTIFRLPVDRRPVSLFPAHYQEFQMRTGEIREQTTERGFGEVKNDLIDLVASRADRYLQGRTLEQMRRRVGEVNDILTRELGPLIEERYVVEVIGIAVESTKDIEAGGPIAQRELVATNVARAGQEVRSAEADRVSRVAQATENRVARESELENQRLALVEEFKTIRQQVANETQRALAALAAIRARLALFSKHGSKAAAMAVHLIDEVPPEKRADLAKGLFHGLKPEGGGTFLSFGGGTSDQSLPGVIWGGLQAIANRLGIRIPEDATPSATDSSGTTADPAVGGTTTTIT